MITFFTTGKPFEGHSGIIQRNALKSWKLLHPEVEVILFGDEPGAAEIARELGLRHEPCVERHKSGMKYLNYLFAKAQEIASHPYLCYSNCDIVLMSDFRQGFESVLKWRKSFLLIAQRWDTDVTSNIDFDNPDWERLVRGLAVSGGMKQTYDFVDFFAFRKGLYDHVPPFVLGRSSWDSWLVWKALSVPVPVVDGTPFFVAVHQNHEYGYHPQGKKGTNEDDLAMRNRALAGDGSELNTLLDVTHKLTREGRIRKVRFRKQLGNPQVRKTWQFALESTFETRKRFGLRRDSIRKLLAKFPHTDSTNA
jgi:hypothetical protein